MPHAEENDFLPGGSGYADYEAHELYYWPYFGIEGGPDPLVANASGIVTHDTLPPGEVGVRRGDRVHASDGEIGRVEGLVVEPGRGHVTHVLLQEGHLWGRKEVAIPIGAVERMADGITVAMTKHEIGDLPCARPLEVRALTSRTNRGRTEQPASSLLPFSFLFTSRLGRTWGRPG